MSVSGPERESEGAPNLRVLKIIVTVLGVLILVFAGAVVWGLVRKPPQPAAEAAAQAPMAATPVTGFGSQMLALPVGARVLDAQAAEARLIVRVLRPDGSEQILLYALTGGAKLGELNVVHRQ